MNSPLLEARGLVKSYDDGRIQALRGVEVRIEAGEYVAISGPSGSGKSTLLHMLGGLDEPTEGEVLFQGSPLGSEVDLDGYRSRQVGFIFQAFYLLPTLCAVENVQVAMLAAHQGANHRAVRAAALLEEMGLKDRMRHYPNELSAGERQRVAIARALANDPTILLADEPTGNLDTANSAHIMEILCGIQKKRGMTLVIVTHENEIATIRPTAHSHPRWKDRGMRALRAAWAAALAPLLCAQAANLNINDLLATQRKQIETADFRATGHLVCDRCSRRSPQLSHHDQGALVSRRAARLGRDRAAAVSRTGICGNTFCLRCDPMARTRFVLPIPATRLRALFPLKSGTLDPLGPGFNYEDFLEQQYFWPGQTSEGQAKFGARNCDVIRSTPGRVQQNALRGSENLDRPYHRLPCLR